MKFLMTLAALSAGLVLGNPAQAQDNKIALKLFGQNVLEGYNACQFALWQHNRDPRKNKYSYVFFAPFNDGEELPGWMKIGKDVISLSRVDRIRAGGQRIEHIRLYEDKESGYRVLMEFKKQHVSGDDIIIDDAKLTIIRKGRFPFISNTKGHISCPQPDHQSAADTPAPAPTPPVQQARLSGDAISLSRPREFNGLKGVPRALLNALRQQAPNCEPQNTPGFGERYAISNDMTLWALPCNLYARTGTTVFMAALNDMPQYGVVLPVFDVNSSEERQEVPNPQVTSRGAVLSFTDWGQDDSCGTHWRYQLRAVEGEAVEFQLLEKRAKASCDGKFVEPSSFPLKFSARP
jgi:hypothetical protein